ncbi:hypothetical protein Ddc_08667 [Ditylenchus destructor]|nr:hypothetical protein Ddc_08667 [Ditylenchus destructor]
MREAAGRIFMENGWVAISHIGEVEDARDFIFLSVPIGPIPSSGVTDSDQDHSLFAALHQGPVSANSFTHAVAVASPATNDHPLREETKMKTIKHTTHIGCAY